MIDMKNDEIRRDPELNYSGNWVFEGVLKYGLLGPHMLVFLLFARNHIIDQFYLDMAPGNVR